MSEFSVTYLNEQVGSVEIIREGLFTTLRCSCTYFSKVMRLYGVSDEGYAAIGILVPVGGRLRLVKKYTKNDLQNMPLETITGFELYPADETPVMQAAATEEPEEVVEVVAAEAEEVVEAKPEIGVWRNIDDPSSLFADPELTETASLIKNGMAAEDEDGTTLFAIPISADAPFPLMPVFRYGWSAMVEGKCCIVFRLKDGELI